MLSKSLILFVVGTIGNVTSFILYMSPLPTIWYIYRKRSTQKFSPAPYVTSLLACSMWFFYGSPLVKNGILIATINGFGALLQLSFVVTFILCAVDGKTRLKTIAYTVIVAVGLSALVTGTVLGESNKTKRVLIVGSIAVATSSIMFASPLATTKLVIVERNTKYMPLYFTLGALSNAAVWTVYGIISLDKFVIIPNATGTALSLFQVFLHVLFRKSSTAKMDEFKTADEKAAANNKVDTFSIDIKPTQGKANPHDVFVKVAPEEPKDKIGNPRK